MSRKAAATPTELQSFEISYAAVLRVYAYFFRFIRPYLGAFVLISVLMFIQIPVSQLALFLTRNLTDQALLATDRPTADRLQTMKQILMAQAGFWLMGQVLWKIREYLNWYCFMRGTIDLRVYFYRHLHRLPLDFLRRRTPGEHLYRATSDIMTNHNDPFDAGLMGMVAWTVLPVIETLYTLGWAGYFLFLVDPWLAYAVAVYGIPYTYIAHLMTGNVRRAATAEAYANAAETSAMRDSIGGLRAVKSTGKAPRQRRILSERVNAVVRNGIKTRLLSSLTGDGTNWLVRWLFTSGLHLYMAWRVVTGLSTIGDWAATFLIVEGVRLPIESLVSALQSIRIWTINGQRVMQTLGVVPTLEDRSGAVALPALVGRIELDQVELRYDADRAALNGVSIAIAAGESIGLVGPSGAGKSSVINLLLRLYQPQAGTVLVDSLDLAGVQLSTWLDQVALVPQSTFLYDGTIRENLQFGRPRATDDLLWDALRQAEAEGFVRGLPGGLDYLVGDATTISGGERQRLGLARALVRHPRVMLLDEATANLDPATEEEVIRTLERLYAGHTVVVVAHRLKAVAGCDRIVVMQDGRVTDEGTHTELLARAGWYARMWQQQHETEANQVA